MSKPRLPGALAAAALVALLAAPAFAIKVEKIKASQVRSMVSQSHALAYSGWSADHEVEVVAEQANVRFDLARSTIQWQAALDTIGAKLDRYNTRGWTRVILPAGMPVTTGMMLIKGLPGVLEISPNYVYRPLKTSNDPQVFNQYHLGKINAFSAWEYEVGSSSPVTIAVIDSGVETTHPDLSTKLAGLPHVFCDPGVGGASTKQTGADNSACVLNATPSCGHGTEVAGVAAAVSNNGVGVAGVSWGAKILSANVFNPTDCPSDTCTEANCATDDWAIADAINYSTGIYKTTTYGRFVINISLGGPFACPDGNVVDDAIDAAVAAGIPVIVSAGNDGDAINSPANCANAIPVGATNESDAIASFSSRGTELANNGVVAPGVNIRTTAVNANYTAGATGTSFSAPIVSGIAALIISKDAAIHSVSPMTATQVQSTLRGSAESIGVAGTASYVPRGASAGAGRVNAFRALKLTVNGTLAGFAGDEKAIAFPNPFRPSSDGFATITIPTGLKGTNPRVRIYTIDGQLVRDLGGNTSWNGRNDGGNPVATGTYIFHVKTDAGDQAGRVAVIR